MSIVQAMLVEFDVEVITTRRFLNRLPEDALSWKPHPKSLSAGQLALHIASVPGAVLTNALPDVFQVPDFGANFPIPSSTRQILEALDVSVATVRDVLPTLDDARMLQPLSVVSGERKLMEMPRIAFLRSIMFNHVYHHRGQFGVYLRLIGVAVPAAYGPSGDEAPAALETVHS